MILNDFTQPKLKFSREKLDAVLVELCGMVIEGQQNNPDFYGMVAAAVLDPQGRLVAGVNYLYNDERIHAERAAIDKYEEEYGALPKGSIVITTLSPCSEDTHDNRYGVSCTDLLNKKHIKLAYCGYSDPSQDNTHEQFTIIITENSKIKLLCKKLADTFLKNGLNELKIDNVNGLGSVPWNQEVDYMGLKVLMKPSTFLQLSLPLTIGDEDRKTIAHLEKEKDTKGFGAPFLQVDVDREFPRITGHDGRHRMLAIKDTEGDHPVEVHIFPRGMRNKDITSEVVGKLNDLVVSQNGKYVPGPIFTQPTNENFADGKGPGRPGDSQRHGIPKGATMAELEKASHSKGRKGQLARWQLNMRRGKKK